MQQPEKRQARLLALKRQAEHLAQRVTRLNVTSDRYSSIRLTVFLAGALASFVSPFLVGPWLFVVALIVTVLTFSVVVNLHRRVNAAITRYSLWRKIKLGQVARMELDWEHIPAALAGSPDSDHPFEIDLDLTGARSVHQLIDTAVSREGSERLRDWLLEPNPEHIQARQGLVRELAALPIFRDKLALKARLAARDTDARLEGGRLLSWIAHYTLPDSLRSSLIVLSGLAVINIVLFILNSLGLIPPLWGISMIVYAGIFMIRTRELGDSLFENALALQEVLGRLRAIFEYLEHYPYGDHAHLKALCAPFLDRANRPSVYLRRISRVVPAASIRGNPFLWLIIHAVVPWDVYFAYLLSRYKTELAERLPGWLDAWYELEALNSLASFAYLNPNYTFPVVAAEPAESPVVFRGQALGHPLIPADRKVCNDFALDSIGRVVIITGSNMAGKSSFLRTLGVNLCLAYAGGPVNAECLEIPLYRLFTCIKVSDSVTDGFSYFYAEVRRLKALLSALENEHPYPLFFLIDEIFRGTNNRERLIGSRAYVRALAGKHGVGVISTHDLELIKLADELPQVSNAHFREEVINERMVFDYKLRPGPSPTTNALKIMYMAGLPVDPEALEGAVMPAAPAAHDPESPGRYTA
jgi:hypothetical protein